MLPNVKPTKLYPIKTKVTAQSVAAAATVTSGWIPTAELDWLKITSIAGAGAGTFAVKVEQATAVGGTGAKDMVTAAQTGITAQANSTEVEVDIRIADYLDVDNAFNHVRLSVTCTGGAGSLYAAALFGGPVKFLD